MTPFLAEYLGTFILIFLGNGVVANSVLKGTLGKGSNWFVITTAWALAVFCGVSISATHSGAHINPAVTLAFASAKLFPWKDVVPYITAQLLGAFTASILVYIFYFQHYKKTPDVTTQRATFCTSPAIPHKGFNFFSEMIGTFILAFVVLFFEAPEITLKNIPTERFGLGALGALPVAFLVWGIGLSLGGTTGYAINPARDFAPRLAYAILVKNAQPNWAYAAIPILGPLTGGIVAAIIYLLIK